jgi:hypothetical protein
VPGEHGVIDMAVWHRPSFLLQTCARMADSRGPRLPHAPLVRLAPLSPGAHQQDTKVALDFRINFGKLLSSSIDFIVTCR